MRWRPRKAEVEVTRGPERGRRVDVGPSGLRVGSGPDAGLCLADPLVGRRHLQLVRAEEGLWLHDLGAVGGTRLEGHRVERACLEGDASLTVGETELTVHLGPGEDLVLAGHAFAGVGAWSPSLRHALHRVAAAAHGDETVLLEGDPGVGKDAVARALHELGRPDEPFVAVDGAAEDVEVRLLGRRDRGRWLPGAAHHAAAGTLFVDDAGALPAGTQLRLAEILGDRILGGGERLRARVILATPHRLAVLALRGRYASSLTDRVRCRALIPPLAFRPEDVGPLAARFWRGAREDDMPLPPALVPILEAHDWPGNARELRAVVEQLATMAALAEGERPTIPSFARYDHLPYHDAKNLLVGDFQRWLLPQVVDRCGGSVARAAGVLGIPRTSLYRMLDDVAE